jgi:hypothetical protein
MIYRTKITGRTVCEEYVQCDGCGFQFFQANVADECPHCKSDAFTSYQRYTVYQTINAKNPQDAIDTAFDMGEWQTMEGSIVIETKEGTTTI